MNHLQLLINPVLPVWLIILLAIAGIVLTFFQYKTLSTKIRFLLIGLRWISILCLTAIILNPIFVQSIEIAEKPNLGIILDHSESVNISNGRYQAKQSISPILEAIKAIPNEKLNLISVLTGNTVRNWQTDTLLSFNDTETDLFSPLAYFNNNNKTISEVIFITDGNATINRDPVFAAQDASFPIHAIALGDTTQIKDLSIQLVQNPREMELNISYPVVFSVTSNGFDGRIQTEVQLKKNGTTIRNLPLYLNSAHPHSIDTLYIEADKHGTDRWEINVLPLKNEFTIKNNHVAFTTTTIDPSHKVVHIAFAIHPDVKALRQVLLSIKNISTTTLTWLGGERFMEGNLAINSDSVSALIIHGYPSAGFPTKLKNTLDQLVQDIPTAFFMLPGQYLPYSENINERLPISINQTRFESMILPLNTNPGESSHPILSFPGYSGLDNFYANVLSSVNTLKPNTHLLLYGNDARLGKMYPAFAVQQSGNKRYSQFLMYNFYEWIQNGGDQRKTTEEFMNNMTQWLITQPDDQLFYVHVPDRDISDNEEITVQAELKDEKGLPDNNASLQAEVFLKDSLITSFNLKSDKNGKYSAKIGPLSDGVYLLKTTALIKDRIVGKSTKNITVSGTSNEYRVINRNTQNLTNIALISGGEMVDFKDGASFIKNRVEKLTAKTHFKEVEKEIPLIHSTLWVLLLIATLTAEWLLRKKIGLA